MLDTPGLAETSRPRRRFFTAEHKQRIVQEALVPGASVSRIALLHDVNANQVFKWKRECLRSQTGSQPEEHGLFPVVVTDHAQPAVPDSPSPDQRQTAPTQGGSIELHLARGRVVLKGHVNTEVLRIVLYSLAMIGLPAGTRIWLAAGFTDMRCGFNGPWLPRYKPLWPKTRSPAMYSSSAAGAATSSKYCGGVAMAYASCPSIWNGWS